MMRLALSTGFLNPRSLEELIRVCEQSGTREIEVWAHDGLFTELTDTQRVRRSLAARGITVVSVHSPFKNDGVLRSVETDAYLRRFDETCRNAERLEAEFIVAHPLVVDDERWVEHEAPPEGMPRSFRLWRRLAESSQSRGLQIAFENVPRSRAWPRGCRLGPLAVIVNVLAMENVGLCLDLSHCFANRDDPVAFLSTEERAPLLIHTSDGVPEQDRHLPPGEGDQDWYRLLAQLGGRNYRGPLILEVRSPYLDGHLVAAMYAYLQDKAGSTGGRSAAYPGGSGSGRIPE